MGGGGGGVWSFAEYLSVIKSLNKNGNTFCCELLNQTGFTRLNKNDNSGDSNFKFLEQFILKFLLEGKVITFYTPILHRNIWWCRTRQ